MHKINTLDTGFYLTGGTGLSRGYLNHRFSEDLDFFVNDDDHFQLWANRVVQSLSISSTWNFQINQREERYFRLNLEQNGINLKIEMINDVPVRVGTPLVHPVLGKLDTAENILANKITAVIDRSAPKDLADIWGICTKLNLSLDQALSNAQGKAAGVFPVDLARVLCSTTVSDWKLIRWIKAPEPEQFCQELNLLGQSLILL